MAEMETEESEAFTGEVASILYDPTRKGVPPDTIKRPSTRSTLVNRLLDDDDDETDPT